MPDVAVLGASGFAGALAAQLLWRHPSFELVAVTSRSDAGRRLDDLYPRHRVPLELEELDLDRHAQVDAAVVAYPHGASAEVVARAARTRRARGRPLGRLPPSRRFALRALVRAAPGARADRRGGVRADRALPRAHGGRAAGGQPGLLSDRRRAHARAARARGADRGRGDRRQDRHLGRRAGARPSAPTSSPSTRTSCPTASAAHRHSPEIDQELEALGAGAARATFVPHLVPLDQGELVSCYVTPARETDEDELRSLYERAYEDEPFVEVAERPPGVRDVRETNLCRIHVHHDRRSGPDPRLRSDRQPLEGNLLAGGAEPQPDVRPARR